MTRYVNAEQKSPADEASMRQQLLKSGFPDRRQVRAIMTGDAFRAGLEDQVKFFVDLKQIPGTLPLDEVIVRTLLPS